MKMDQCKSGTLSSDCNQSFSGNSICKMGSNRIPNTNAHDSIVLTEWMTKSKITIPHTHTHKRKNIFKVLRLPGESLRFWQGMARPSCGCSNVPRISSRIPAVKNPFKFVVWIPKRWCGKTPEKMQDVQPQLMLNAQIQETNEATRKHHKAFAGWLAYTFTTIPCDVGVRL